jgi:hypothetical protein
LLYCRKCGTKLEEDSHFCQKCGTPVIANVPEAPSNRPAPRSVKNNPILIAIVLSILLIVGLLVVALFSVSLSTVNVNQTFQDDTANINRLNLIIQTAGTKVNVITQNINNNNFLISLQGQGSKRLFSGDSESPVKVEFYNTTANDALTITAKIVESSVFSRFNLECTIYVNPDLILNLNVSSNAGEVSLSSDKAAIFESLILQTNAGTVEANLQNTTISGDISLKTNLGKVNFRIMQSSVAGNQIVDLNSNAGTINMDITQNETLKGNLLINAETSLGSVDVGLHIDGDVAAKVIARTNLGSVRVTQQNFSGNQTPIQSNNYPADSNIEIDCSTNLGSVNINAQYQSASGGSVRN